MIQAFVTLAILTAIMIGAVSYGIYESGSPFETRGKIFDQQRISDISNLTYAIESYYNKNKLMPNDLEGVKDYLYGVKNTTDPETKKDYEYKITGATSYQICTTFSSDTTKTDENDRFSYYPPDDKYKHPKGYYCLTFDVVNILNTSYSSEANPVPDDFDPTKRARDASRLTDLANLQQAINVSIQESTQSGTLVYCSNTSTFPCNGKSITDSKSSDGTGWVKINLANQKSVSIYNLPIDPQNNGIYHYTYCANDNSWEINTVLESAREAGKMSSDGGDDLNKYEVGSNLNLIGKIAGCNY